MQTKQLLATALVGLSCAAWAAPSLRIMPLGDSITRGDKSPDTAGYRGPLWTKLLAAGYNEDYVGTATDYPGTVSGMTTLNIVRMPLQPRSSAASKYFLSSLDMLVYIGRTI